MKLIQSFFILILISLGGVASASEKMKENILQSLENFARDHRIQATYELSANSKTIVSGAQGYADFEQNKRLSRSQMMPVLSLTKQITAASILVLEDRGDLKVTDSLGKHFKAFENIWEKGEMPSWFKEITIHNLLVHSSGLPDYIGKIEVTKEGGRKAFEKNLGYLILKQRQTFKPGSKYDYNNTNYYLLGLIIEEISGKDLDFFYKAELFDPIGMSHTYLLSFDEAIDLQQSVPNEKFPVRYFASPSETSPKLTPTPKVSLLAPGADCGLVSTAADMVKWNEALHHGKILSKTSYKKMITPYFKVINRKIGYNSKVGYGLYISILNNGKKFYHHTTSGYGVRCDAGYIPQDNIALAILSNILFRIPEGMASKIDFRKPENQIDIAYLRDAMLESL